MSALEPWLVLFTAQVGWNSAIFIESKNLVKSFHRFDMIEVWYRKSSYRILAFITFGFKEPFEHLFTI